MGAKSQMLDWERRWSVAAGVATLVAVLLLVLGAVVSGPVHGDGKAEILESAHEHSSALLLGGVLQALGFALLIAPLVVLFRAAQARSDRVRGQLIGLIVAAPLFFAVATVLNAGATNDAASQFVAGDARPGIGIPAAQKECRTEQKDQGAKEFGEEFNGATPAEALQACADEKVADDAAENAIDDASLEDAATGFGIGGRLGLAIALIYVGLWAMRLGLLTRFWGSLGMALGVATLLGLVLFLVIWFLYIGLLLVGLVPGGRPPAWAAGEAIPWPSPGQKAAAGLEPDDAAGVDDQRSQPEEGERRKRKQRE
jgi:hypothetical protein